jgi:acyl carrier protein
MTAVTTTERITRSEILQLLREGLNEIAPDRQAKTGPLAMETELAALNLDSVATMEMIAYVEDRLGIIITEERLARGRLVSDLVELIHAQVAAHG